MTFGGNSTVHVGAVTHVGKVRAKNEDGFLVRGNLLAVADGMGGHNAGEIASDTVLAVLRDYPFYVDAQWLPGGPTVSRATDGDMEAATEWAVEQPTRQQEEQLRAAIVLAHRRLLAMTDADTSLSGMGTTLTAALLGRDTIYVAHVGDSRLYLLRDGQLVPLTKDHSVAAELLRAGQIDEDAARRHPLRHAVTRALGAGAHDELDVDIHAVSRRPGDGVLLCTDGLSALVRDGDILRILQEQSDVQIAANALVDLALARGGTDNVTVVLARPAGDGVNR